jgi:hypothetical protein
MGCQAVKFPVRNAELLARINGRHPLSWLCEEVHRLYNKRATGQRKDGGTVAAEGAGQWPPSADILEELTHDMQQEQCTQKNQQQL